jgi:hypothetical protein
MKVGAGRGFAIACPPAPLDAVAQDIPLVVAYEDEHLIVVDKPAGLVVHPARAIPTARWSTRCCIIARASFRASAGCARASSIASTRTPRACWWWPRAMWRMKGWPASLPTIRSSAPIWPSPGHAHAAARHAARRSRAIPPTASAWP